MQNTTKPNQTKVVSPVDEFSAARAAERHPVSPSSPATSYPRFNDGGSRVQNALHLPQGRDDKKITSDNGGHGVSWDKAAGRRGWEVGGRGGVGAGWWEERRQGENHE